MRANEKIKLLRRLNKLGYNIKIEIKPERKMIAGHPTIAFA